VWAYTCLSSHTRILPRYRKTSIETRFSRVAGEKRAQNDERPILQAPGYADPETDVQMRMTIAPLKAFVVSLLYKVPL
jgi:hypothetical protein